MKKLFAQPTAITKRLAMLAVLLSVCASGSTALFSVGAQAHPQTDQPVTVAHSRGERKPDGEKDKLQTRIVNGKDVTCPGDAKSDCEVPPVSCKDDEALTGGGYSATKAPGSTITEVEPSENEATVDANGKKVWKVRVFNDGGPQDSFTIHAQAECTKIVHEQDEA